MPARHLERPAAAHHEHAAERGGRATASGSRARAKPADGDGVAREGHDRQQQEDHGVERDVVDRLVRKPDTTATPTKPEAEGATVRRSRCSPPDERGADGDADGLEAQDQRAQRRRAGVDAGHHRRPPARRGPRRRRRASLRHTGPMWRSVRQQKGAAPRSRSGSAATWRCPRRARSSRPSSRGTRARRASSIAVTAATSVPVARARIAPTAATISDPAGRRARRSRAANAGRPGSSSRQCKCPAPRWRARAPAPAAGRGP